ncbi:hypothetical protein [Campylobacter concisus]|uniref:hypothetical protein n=1 Tax=Campylobacter concisus TaxID=199 RepID=UPI00131E45FA|nr:hypothetical protein [Campylobacter concisus]
MKSQIYVVNLKELGFVKFELLMMQINLKLWQICPLFAKSNLAQILTAILNLKFKFICYDYFYV